MGRGKRSLVASRGRGRISLSDSTGTRQVIPESVTAALVQEAAILRPSTPVTADPRLNALLGRVVIVSGAVPGYQNRQMVLDAIGSAGARAEDDAKHVSASTVLFVSGLQHRKLEQYENGTLPKQKLSSKVKAALDRGATIVKVESQSDFDNVLQGRVPV